MSTIEGFHCIQDTSPGPQGVHNRGVPLYQCGCLVSRVVPLHFILCPDLLPPSKNSASTARPRCLSQLKVSRTLAAPQMNPGVYFLLLCSPGKPLGDIQVVSPVNLTDSHSCVIGCILQFVQFIRIHSDLVLGLG